MPNAFTFTSKPNYMFCQYLNPKLAHKKAYNDTRHYTYDMITHVAILLQISEKPVWAYF